jgi:murein DD-endopeptidase MepM/ murein hydrolase activator NlpD
MRYRYRKSGDNTPFLKRAVPVLLVLLAAGGVWLWLVKFESEKPAVSLAPESRFVAPELKLSVQDRKSGLAELTVEAVQGERTVTLLQEVYPDGPALVERTLAMRPVPKDLADGELRLRITAKDRSWKHNKTILDKALVLDSRPPRPVVLGGPHYINQGGAGLVVVTANEELSSAGVQVGEAWFSGFPLAGNRYAVYFALPHGTPAGVSFLARAEDSAGNRGEAHFQPNVKLKPPRRDRIEVSDGFLAAVIPYFKDQDPSLQGTDLEIFLAMNRTQREKDAEKIRTICRTSTPERLWSGAFTRMLGKPTAAFGQERAYYYRGEEVDRQVHLGVDIASLVQSPIPAGNGGTVVFTGPLGIYGETVILDHGCGLFSMYSHLSVLDVSPGAAVAKDQILGRTGQTGMAGGDHLHFAVIVQGVFVDPVEWWDPHWIQDNIDLKLK